MNEIELENILISGIIRYYNTIEKNKVLTFSDPNLYSKKNQELLLQYYKFGFINDKDFTHFKNKKDVTLEELEYSFEKFKKIREESLVKKLKLSISEIKNYNDIERILEENKINYKKNIEANTISQQINTAFFQKYQGVEVLGSSSGLKSIDEVTDGFFGLTAITGAPGFGKTTLAIQSAYHNAFELNSPVIYITLEVNKNMFISKMASHMIELDLKKVLKEYLPYEYAKEKYKACLKIYNNKYFYLFDKEDDISLLNLREIIKEVKKIHNKNPLVIIDYFQLYHDRSLTKHLSQKNEKEELMMEELIKLKNETEANFIAIMTKNKAGYKVAAMSSLKGSNALEYGLETILSLEDPEDVGENFIEDVNVVANVMKNRWGEKKVNIPLHFDGKKSKFRDIKLLGN